MTDQTKRAEEVWGNINLTEDGMCYHGAIHPKDRIAIALEQAYREGVEAMRDAIIREPWAWDIPERTKDVADSLLSKSEEVKE